MLQSNRTSRPWRRNLCQSLSQSSINESDYDSFVARHQELEINKLFRACVKLEASDLHLKVGSPPMVRVDGSLRPMNRGPIDDEEMVRLCFPLMNERSRKIFDHDGGADFAHMCEVEGTNWRFRVNLLQQLGPHRDGRPAGQ